MGSLQNLRDIPRMQSAGGPAPLRGARHQVSGRNLLCEFATLLRPARPTATSSSPPVAASACIASATTSQPYSPVSASASHQGRNTQRCAKFAAVGDRENHDHNVRALLVRKNQTTFSQVGLRVRIPLAPAASHLRTCHPQPRGYRYDATGRYPARKRSIQRLRARKRPCGPTNQRKALCGQGQVPDLQCASIVRTDFGRPDDRLRSRMS